MEMFALLLVAAFATTAVRAQVSAPDFTVIVVPDPQNETQNYPQVLNSQMQWIVNNQKSLNVQIVLTEGDNINDGASTTQMQNLNAAFRLLDNAGIPYLLGIGNHDYNGGNPKARDLTGFDQWFGPGRYAGKPYFKGNYPAGSNANSYAVLTINGKEFLFMTFEYRPTSSSLDWAESILSANPTKEAVIVAHSFVLKNNYREDTCDDQDMSASNATGQATWMRLRKYSNVIMFLSGHFTGGSGARRSDLGNGGNLVNQLFADYQDYPNGGNGWLRVMTFHPASNTITVTTYSPFLNQYMTTASNQFTLIYHNTFPNTGSGTISGKVRKQSTCAAIPGITVSGNGRSTTTAADGSYRLSVTPGTYTFSAKCEAYFTTERPTITDTRLASTEYRRKSLLPEASFCPVAAGIIKRAPASNAPRNFTQTRMVKLKSRRNSRFRRSTLIPEVAAKSGEKSTRMRCCLRISRIAMIRQAAVHAMKKSIIASGCN